MSAQQQPITVFGREFLQAVVKGGKQAMKPKEYDKRVKLMAAELLAPGERVVEWGYQHCLTLYAVGSERRLIVSSGYHPPIAQASIQCAGLAQWRVCIPAKPLTDWLRSLDPRGKSTVSIVLFERTCKLEIRYENITANFLGLWPES